ncbi:MAG: nucleotidyltransferase domain-containing protein [Methylibium sp.]|uniref:nucleotidyltransferase family protein n=1 Tax=Methylibium sp. TaxID=2067992 RepID=UPI0018525316|nr:nucleotidyltransferase domain-containing protein [Methylibium sp.]MBA3599020.1 nucleotidyltransferase domain-containing protein [Methylibium sp.]
MNALIQSRLPELERLCHRLGVQQLDLFGSAAPADFNAERSDIDFLVTLAPTSPPRYADAYFELKAGLESLFQRPVDLVTDASLTNPYRRARIESERLRLYAA